MGTFEAYGSTVINGTGDSYREITWDDWSALTREQQAAIPRAVITDVPGVNGTVNAELMKLLWTNPNPTATFAAQDITLSSSDYDFLLIVSNVTGGAHIAISSIAQKGQHIYLGYPTYNNGVISIFRTATRVSDTVYSFGPTQVNGQSDNDNLIPVAIYGFKSSITIDASGIISDVSTDASKCKLSNGTSVEDALSVESLTSQYATTGLVSCLKYGKLIQAVLEFTPSAIAHGTVLIAKLPATLAPCYLSLGMANGQSLPCLLSNVSGQSYANIIAYYPGSLTASRIDATISYLTTL